MRHQSGAKLFHMQMLMQNIPGTIYVYHYNASYLQHFHFVVNRNNIWICFSVFWCWCLNWSSNTWSIVVACMVKFKFTESSINGCFRQNRCAWMFQNAFLGLNHICFSQKAKQRAKTKPKHDVLFRPLFWEKLK